MAYKLLSIAVVFCAISQIFLFMTVQRLRRRLDHVSGTVDFWDKNKRVMRDQLRGSA
jgi:hypothetical protein